MDNVAHRTPWPKHIPAATILHSGRQRRKCVAGRTTVGAGVIVLCEDIATGAVLVSKVLQQRGDFCVPDGHDAWLRTVSQRSSPAPWAADPSTCSSNQPEHDHRVLTCRCIRSPAVRCTHGGCRPATT
eukprot:m.933723 g.933723  ORF g.933723 m.933723 type:complete len:128 (-) comp23796_c0_seq17:2228-2611(-)